MTRAEFLELTLPHQPLVYKIARFYTDRPEDREDLIQEIWLQLLLAFGRFKHQSKVSTWMYRVALNTALTYSRKANGQKLIFSNTDITGVDALPSLSTIESGAGYEQEMVLWQMIHKLNKNDRALILLYVDGLSYKEMADITGESESNVGVRLNRIKIKMKNELMNNYQR